MLTLAYYQKYDSSVRFRPLPDTSYYNNISSLDELQRLKHTPSLKELDLRLNPVTRSEPDYRLYLIHMLPSLQKLG